MDKKVKSVIISTMLPVRSAQRVHEFNLHKTNKYT